MALTEGFAFHSELVVVASANQRDFFRSPLTKLSVLDVHDGKLAGNNAFQLVYEFVGRALSFTEAVVSHSERMVVSRAHERHESTFLIPDKHQFDLHELIRLVVSNLGVRFDWTIVEIGFAFERHLSRFAIKSD
jgi:hypothetical protein